MDKQISVILTAWKRSSIEEQLQRILSQTVADAVDVYVWQNDSHIDITDLKKKYPFEHIHSSKNFKFHGRFALPLLLNTEYTVILDDDTLPNSHWLDKCVRLCCEHECIVGGNGRVIHPQFHACGDMYEMSVDDPQKDTEVDYVGHCWFFKTDWVRAFWMQRQPTFETGEDISFCAALKLAAGIRSVVSGKENVNEIGDSNRHKYGTDANSSYSDASATIRRSLVIPYWRNLGWKFVSERT